MSIEIPRYLSNEFSKAAPTPEVAIAVEALAGPLAHHLNNSLGIVLGYTEVVMSSLHRDHPHFADLMEVRTAAWRCVELAEQMLTFTGRDHVEPDDIDLCNAIESHLRECRYEVQYFPGDRIGRLYMDEARLRRLLDILLENALAAVGPEGFVGLYTRAAQDYVEITVLDDGCGVPRDLAPRIFDPLTTSNRASHTGMGLAEAYGIVMRSGGSISFASTPGQGSAFRVSLPMSATDSAEPV